MRLRFTIRDLLWLTLVVAMALGWWWDHLRTARGLWSVGEFEKAISCTQLEKAMHDPIDGPALWQILKRYGFYEEWFNNGQRQQQ